MIHLMQKITGTWLVAFMALSANATQPLWPSLEGRVLCGYQGWFRTPSDTAQAGWRHYVRQHNGVASPVTDYLPDVSEAAPQDRACLPLAFKNREQAEVVSSDNPATVDRHFAWMKQYGIDGVMVQRFPTDMYNKATLTPSVFRASGDRVLRYCRDAAVKYGRSYTLMYDLSGLTARASEIVIADWQHLVSSGVIRGDQDVAWQHHKNKPLVAIWGVGFNDNRKYDLAACERLVDFFKTEGYAVLLGVPFRWRTLEKDAVSDQRLLDIIRKADVVHSWSVGRYHYEQVKSYTETVWRDDVAWCQKEGLTFMPVVFPGFSWKNLKGVTTDIPRHDGAFLWSQFEVAKRLGASCAYVAMFDEVDEGTQIFKINNHPPQGKDFSYQSYSALPSDHYLWLTGQATQAFRTSKPFPPDMPNAKDVTQYVNPLIGGAATGHTFPGACAPFGLVQASPDTGNANWMYCSGYVFTDEKIRGFSQTHLNGTGCADLGDMQIQPFTGDVKRSDFFSSYKKETQKSCVGYYGVTLEDFGVNVEITATPRVAFYRMTYQKAEPARLLIDLQHGLADGQGQIDNRVLQGESKKEDAFTISGWSQTKGWVTRYYYYVITFDHPIAAMQKLEAKKGEKGARYVLDFNLKAGETVQSKIALSSVSIDGAKKNLKAEARDWDFEAVQCKTRASWNTFLSRAVIEGTQAQKENFYTSMYHLFIQPADIADVDGQYRGADDKVASIPGGSYYSTLSLWDTYRAAHPLYTLLAPELVDGFVNTMIAHHKAQGYLPIWTLWGKENHCMVGIHSIPVIVDAYLKGFRGFDVADAYLCIKESITKQNQGFECEAYDKYGYLPFDTTKGGSVSRLVEHGYDDYCAAQFAKALGKNEDAAFFAKRADYYKNVFDPETKFLRGKDTKGNWRTPFDPVALSHWGSDYVEGNAWQYTWHVMQDPEGLIQLMGGKKAFSEKLSSLFVQPQHITGEKVLDVTGLIGQYAHGNEPSHHVIYFFNYADDAWKGEELVRKVFETQYKNTPDGLCGNDDCGQMSAWYIFSAMGFYPFNPCNDGYTFGAPQLPKVTLTLPGDKCFTVEAKGLSDANKYVKSITLNGKPVSGFKLAHRDIMKGGSLVFEMSHTPGK